MKFVLLGIAFLIPSSAVGFLLENLLIDYLGNLFTLLLIGGVTVAFNTLLYAVFGLIDLSRLKKLPLLAKPADKNHPILIFNGFTALRTGTSANSNA